MADQLLADRDAPLVDDIYNVDETGFLMGMIAGGIVVTGTDRRGKPKSVQLGNREWITVIQAINADGWAVQPFIIGAGQYHLANWYRESNLPGDWAITTTQNGWTDNETGLEWCFSMLKNAYLRSRNRAFDQMLYNPRLKD
ncbi:fot5 transposase [Fusarium oxysporum f. sp. phaseoli]